ncbi:MAG: hypothetical protein AABY64_05400 [Bdellovibrionota bacterium]
MTKVYPFVIPAMFILLFQLESQGAKIKSVNGTQLQIETESSEDLSVNGLYYLLNEQQKKVGIIKITRIHAPETSGVLLKGAARVGFPLIKYTKTVASQQNVQRKVLPLQRTPKWGLQVGFLYNNFSVSQSGNSLSMTGISYLSSVSYQDNISKDLIFQIQTGVKNYSVTAEQANININYLALYGGLGYLITDSISCNLGLEYLSPLSKSSNVLALDQIQSNSAASFGFGWRFDPHYSVSTSYNFFLNNKDITASFINLQLGYHFDF